VASRNGVLKLPDGRRVEVGNEPWLVGVWEAAEIVGVERSRFARWLKPLRRWRDAGREGPMPDPLGNVPKPVADLACGPIWLRPDMEEFAENFARRRHQAAAPA
jgi:hypothetical protein